MKKVISIVLIFLLVYNIFWPTVYAVTNELQDNKEQNIVEENNVEQTNTSNTESQENIISDQEENIISNETENTTVEEPEDDENINNTTNTTTENVVEDQNTITSNDKNTTTEEDQIVDEEKNTTIDENIVNDEEIVEDQEIEEQNNASDFQSVLDLSEIETGTYIIQSATNPNMVVEVENLSTANAANIQLGEYTGEQNQKFEISKTSDGYYTIKALHSNKVMDVYAGLSVNGTNVDQYTANESDAQKWSFQENANGTYNIVSKCGGLFLDVYAGLIQDGTNIQIYEANGSTAQNFKLVKVQELTGEKTIENGIYQIASSVDGSYTIGVDNASTTSGANVELQKNENQLSQIFKIEYQNDGTYTIQALHSGNMLDVYAASKANGTNVDQYSANGSDAQKWIIKKESDSSCSIISKCNGLYLDIYAGLIEEGTNVQVYATNGSQAQKFNFVESNLQSIEDGTYKINTELNANMYLEFETNSSNAKIKINELINSQRFNFTYQNDGTYEIKLQNSDKVIGIDKLNSLNGYTVTLQDDKNTEEQRWIIANQGENYLIINEATLYCLDVEAGSSTPGTEVQVYSINGSNAQKFHIQAIDNAEGKQIIEDGIYQITSVINDNMLVEVQGGSLEAGGNIQVGENKNWEYQRFYFAYQGNGYYTIQSVQSGKLVEVYGGENRNGANVQQYDANASIAQQWMIQQKEDGTYIIKSKANGLVMDIYAGEAKQGTNVQVYEENGSNAQKFKLEEPPIMSNGTYRIGTAVGNKMVLDVAGGSTAEGANIQIWASTNVSQQNFIVTYQSNGSYIIEAEHSGKVLQVASDNSNVEQATKNGSKRQEWEIEDAGNGYYYIVSCYNGLYLDVYAGLADNGTNVQVYESNGSNAQKFTFEDLCYNGIDVSQFNGDIDWNLVKRSGVDFAMIRIGYRGYGAAGNFKEDDYFKQNIKEAKAAGLKVGVYFVTQAITTEEAIEEANWVMNKLDEAGFAGNLDFPIALDSEFSTAPNHTGRADNLDVQTRTSLCKTFLDIIEENGYTPMLYASTSWLNTQLDMSQLNDYNIWLAQYADKPTYTGHYEIWQYTSTGSILGIEGYVDLNVGYIKFA